MTNFLILGLESSISRTIMTFLGENFGAGARELFLQNLPSYMFDSVLNMPRVLNIPFPKYKKVSLRPGSEYTFPEM